MRQLVEAAHEAGRSGRWNDALSAYEAALATAHRWAGPSDLAEVIRRMASIHVGRGEAALAGDLFELSRVIAELNGLSSHAAKAMLGEAAVAQNRGDLDQADELYLRAAGIARSAGDFRTVGMAEQNRGILANIRGDVEEAISRYESALAQHQALGDHRLAAVTLNNLGMAHVDQGRLVVADRCFREASVMAEASGDAQVRGMVSLNRAELLIERRSFDEAREACDFAVEIFSDLGAVPSMAEAHKFYGIVYRESGEEDRAAEHFSRSLELARQCQDRLLEGEVASERALLLLGAGRNAEALQALNHAHRILSSLQARREVADLDSRLDQLEATSFQAMRAWAETIESKDLYTAGHCERVAELACMLAADIGISGRDLRWFRMGAILHDVGKIAVPAEVLNKPGRLTDEERALMQRHTSEGDAIVAQMDFPWDIRPLVRSHHEHWAGTGYPDGLSGEEIPLHARILCVADVYDALTTARPYKPALSRDEALEIMSRERARIFDPALFDRFVTLILERTGASLAETASAKH